MINSKNVIPLYKIATLEMLNEAQLEHSLPSFLYRKNKEIIAIELNDDFDGTLFIHDIDPNWAPNEHNLIIEKRFTIKNPSALFGENGVTAKENKIGIAAHIHSRTTNYQEKIKFGQFDYTDKSVKLEFIHEFERDSLRGEINIEFFLYLEESKVENLLQANKVGMKLSQNLTEPLLIIVDGIGSIFPILEINDKSAPLWQMEKNWADPMDDSFDISSVHLKLNIAHSEFKRLKDERTILSRLYMGDIITQVMGAIINDVLNNTEYTINDAEESSPDSILSVVKYWVETFEVDTSDYFTIINTLKKSLENSFR